MESLLRPVATVVTPDIIIHEKRATGKIQLSQGARTGKYELKQI